MRQINWGTWAPIGGTAIVSLAVLAWVAAGTFRVCVPPKLGTSVDHYVKMFAALDAIVDLDIKLATTLTGLGAAILLGLRSGVALTNTIRVWILAASLLFALSALCALWWRFHVAEMWLNNCLDIVTEARSMRRFQAHFYFFGLGLFALGIVVVRAAFRSNSDRSEYDS
jgi:hypothetical protein